MKKENIYARVVSMPSWELFREQEQAYRDNILPPNIKLRIAVEAAASQGWCEWVGDQGKVIGINRFGTSAPAKEIFQHYGITTEEIVRKSKEMVEE